MDNNPFDLGDPPPGDGYSGPRVGVPSCPPPAVGSSMQDNAVVPVVAPADRAGPAEVLPENKPEAEPSVFRRAGGREGLIAAAIAVVLVAAAAFALGGEPAGPAGSSGQQSSPGPRIAQSSPGVGTSPNASGTPDSSRSKLNLLHLDVAAISASTEPAVVDVTSTLANNVGQETGTGMVVSPSGEVLTNNHVIDGATAISAKIDGRGPVYRATLVATDPTADIALIQLVGVSGLKTISVAESASVAVGDAVVAIGNALDLPGPPKVTEGTVTASNVPIVAQEMGTSFCENLTGMIETDVPLEPGNSGGPLLDSQGQVIGINTAASANYDTPAGGSPSTDGFAIPIAKAIAVVTQMRDGEATSTVHIGTSPFLGVEVTSLPGAVASANSCGNQNPGDFDQLEPGPSAPVDSGALVVGVEAGTPAAEAGIEQGDAITMFDGTAVSTPTALTRLVQAESPGDTAEVSWVDLAGETHEARVVLAAGPAD
jgi:S1-C subfamily serine protease